MSKEQKEVKEEVRLSRTGKRLPSTAFKPGQSGNPKGRAKKGETFSDILRGRLELETKEGQTLYELMADKLLRLAYEEGDITAIKYLMDKLDGKPRQSVDMDVRSDSKIEVVINTVKPCKDDVSV